MANFTSRQGFLLGMKVHGMSTLIFFAFLSLLLNISYAQQSENFLNYTNKDMEFSIQYPSNWKVREFEDDKKEAWDDIIPLHTNFDIPNRSAGFTVITEKIEHYLDTETMTIQNTSIEQRVQKEINDWISSDEDKIIRQNWVTVGGKPGYKIEHAWSCERCSPNDIGYGLPDSYKYQIFTIGNGKFYILEYLDEPLKVPETLPLANKMVESFQITR